MAVVTLQISQTVIGAPFSESHADQGSKHLDPSGFFQSGETAQLYGMRRRWYHAQVSKETSGHLDDAIMESRQRLADCKQRGLNYLGHSEDREAYMQRRRWFVERVSQESRTTHVADVVAVAVVVNSGISSSTVRGQTTQACDRKPAIALLRAFFVIALSLSVWFSANAVLPEIGLEYGVSASEASLLTVAVNVGFVIAATASSSLQLADRAPTSRLLLIGTLGCIACNGVLVAPLKLPFAALLSARLLTGAFISLIYPVAMRHVAGWFPSQRRGLAMGCAMAGLVLGVALPSLIRALLPGASWRVLVQITSVMALVGGIGAQGMRDGPFVPSRGAGPSLGALGGVVHSRTWIFTTFSYMGHNFELFAGWSWMGAFLEELLESRSAGSGRAFSHVVTFGVLFAGAIGCLCGGIVADRFGRRGLIAACHIISGLSLASVPSLAEMGAPTALVVFVAAVWSMTTIAESAQYSALISESLKEPRLLGSALGLSLALGFVSTAAGILVVPLLHEFAGWTGAFPLVSLGSLAGLLAIAAVPAAKN